MSVIINFICCVFVLFVFASQLMVTNERIDQRLQLKQGRLLTTQEALRDSVKEVQLWRWRAKVAWGVSVGSVVASSSTRTWVCEKWIFLNSIHLPTFAVGHLNSIVHNA